MAIIPALNAAMLTSINTLQTAALIPSPCPQDAIIGAMMLANATVAAHTWDQVRKELDHLLVHTFVVSGPYVKKGYTQAALHGLS